MRSVAGSIFTEVDSPANGQPPCDSEDALCEKCSKLAHHVHHKDFSHKNNNPGNLQMLCTLCHAKIHGIEPRISELRRLILLHMKTMKARVALNNQIQGYSRIELLVPDFMHELVRALKKQERRYEREIQKHIEKENYPIRSWLKDIRGISFVLSAKIISYFEIEKAKSPSSFWAFAGLRPEDSKTKGVRANWNHAVKATCYQIADCFIKLRNPVYRPIYDSEKARQIDLLEKGSPGAPNYVAHAHLRAMRKMIKAFLKDLWVEWRRLEHLSTS